MPTIEVNESELDLIQRHRNELRKNEAMVLLSKTVSLCAYNIVQSQMIGLSYTEFLSMIGVMGNTDEKFRMDISVLESLGTLKMNTLHEISDEIARLIMKTSFDRFNGNGK